MIEQVFSHAKTGVDGTDRASTAGEIKREPYAYTNERIGRMGIAAFAETDDGGINTTVIKISTPCPIISTRL